jgi:predicted small metal-binding protein
VERGSGIFARLVRYLLIFVVGVAVGYLARARREDERVREAIDHAREEMEELGIDAIDRAKEAGGDIADSAKAAFKEMIEDAGWR